MRNSQHARPRGWRVWDLTVEDTFLAQQPDSHGECEPDKRGEDEGLSEAGARQPDPDDTREPRKADAADGRAECVDGGDDAAAVGPVETGARFVLLFVGFNKARAGGKDGGKGKEEAADHWPASLCDQACEHADNTSEREADDPFVGPDAFNRGEPGMQDHGGYLTRSQNAHEAANHTGMRAMVAARACGLRRSSIQLTQAAYSRNAMAPRIMERASTAA